MRTLPWFLKSALKRNRRDISKARDTQNRVQNVVTRMPCRTRQDKTRQGKTRHHETRKNKTKTNEDKTRQDKDNRRRGQHKNTRQGGRV